MGKNNKLRPIRCFAVNPKDEGKCLNIYYIQFVINQIQESCKLKIGIQLCVDESMTKIINLITYIYIFEKIMYFNFFYQSNEFHCWSRPRFEKSLSH